MGERNYQTKINRVFLSQKSIQIFNELNLAVKKGDGQIILVTHCFNIQVEYMYYSRTGVVKRIPNAQKEDNDHDVSKGFVKIEESAICVVRHYPLIVNLFFFSKI